VVQAEKNLRLFLTTRVVRVETSAGRITAVVGRSILTGREQRFRGALFADCTGDGNVGFLAGADFRVGREARSDTGESLAPLQADQLLMGTSVQWYAVAEKDPVPFPDCPWAVSFTEQTCHPSTRGDWDWETGMNLDQVRDIERIRDHALRVTFGNWAFLKNHSKHKHDFAHQRLAWVAYIGGKRESRRLLGDLVLRQQDIQEHRAFPDACVTATWPIDLHFPHPDNSRYFPGLDQALRHPIPLSLQPQRRESVDGRPRHQRDARGPGNRARATDHRHDGRGDRHGRRSVPPARHLSSRHIREAPGRAESIHASRSWATCRGGEIEEIRNPKSQIRNTKQVAAL
jgi:hypothetical protein